MHQRKNPLVQYPKERSSFGGGPSPGFFLKFNHEDTCVRVSMDFNGAKDAPMRFWRLRFQSVWRPKFKN